MTCTSVPQRLVVWSPPEAPPAICQVSLKLKEQESLSLIKRCQNMNDFRQSHGQIVKWGLLWNSFCASNLLATCALPEWGNMELACSIFNQIEYPGTFDFNTIIKGFVKDCNMVSAICTYCDMLDSGIQPDTYTFPMLLKACSDVKSPEGVQLHGQIVKHGLVEDICVANSLINFYGKCGEIHNSCSIFYGMDYKDVVSWSSIISAHANLRMWEDCLSLLCQMYSEGSCKAEETILVNVLSACANLGALELGKSSHATLLRGISELNVIVETALIDMYAKCGCIDKAMSLFHKMNKNKHSYSVIMSGLAMHGRGNEALEVFSDMLREGVVPDDVIYVSILSACSHAGLVDEGLKVFKQMIVFHKIEPTIQHYGCMVDLLARAGRLGEALEFINSMPIEANHVIWRNLLSACKIYQNLEIAETAASILFHMGKEKASDYLVLSHLYAQVQRWEQVEAIWKRMHDKGIVQTPGFSLVEVQKQVHKFVSQDTSHPQCKDIYEMIHQMEWQLKFEGYSPDTSQVLLNVDEEEKKQRLRAHSQKLALAFALLSSDQCEPIRIARNVRMCSDCHVYTKLISVISHTPIVRLVSNPWILLALSTQRIWKY